jgi:CRISPR type III-B/RAMP module-associated protein Cmr5
VEEELGNLGPKDFATACKKLSTRIMNAGLAGAMAFSCAKAGKKVKLEELKYERSVEAVAKYLSASERDAQDYVGYIIATDAMVLRRDTEEAMAILNWLARIADGKAAATGDEGGGDE